MPLLSDSRPVLLVVAGVVSLLTFVLGCGEAGQYSPAVESELQSYDAESTGESIQTSAAEIAGDDASASPVEASPSTVKRRIIYNTDIGLVVKSYDVFESKLPGMVEGFGGYISSSETNRRYSNAQSGVWVVRIPVDRYSEFLQGVTGLGFAESRREDAQDVTAEFVDVEARMRNSRKLEERVLAMLEDRSGKITDVLEIERELARVREEIERMEGRLRVLADRSALATVTIRCREEQNYAPPAAPTLASRLSGSWSGSLKSLRVVGENLLVAFVAFVPWAAILGIPLAILGLIIRREFRSKS